MVGVNATAWVATSATAAWIAFSRVAVSAAASTEIEVSASMRYAEAGLALARRTRPRIATIESARIFAMSSSTGRPANARRVGVVAAPAAEIELQGHVVALEELRGAGDPALRPRLHHAGHRRAPILGDL